MAPEVGCGCGSAAAPILRDHAGWRVVAIDFAASAVERLRARRLDRVEVLLCDVVGCALPCDGVDVVLCLFVLSSIAPGALAGVVQKLGAALKPGGRLLFRDYGRYDAAQLRFGKGQKVGDHRYVKADGTSCFYFDLDDVSELFAGFDVLSLKLDCRQEANRVDGARRRRVFVEGRSGRQEANASGRGRLRFCGGRWRRRLAARHVVVATVVSPTIRGARRRGRNTKTSPPRRGGPGGGAPAAATRAGSGPWTGTARAAAAAPSFVGAPPRPAGHLDQRPRRAPGAAQAPVGPGSTPGRPTSSASRFCDGPPRGRAQSNGGEFPLMTRFLYFASAALSADSRSANSTKAQLFARRTALSSPIAIKRVDQIRLRHTLRRADPQRCHRRSAGFSIFFCSLLRFIYTCVSVSRPEALFLIASSLLPPSASLIICRTSTGHVAIAFSGPLAFRSSTKAAHSSR